jgi:hypothetical protein
MLEHTRCTGYHNKNFLYDLLYEQTVSYTPKLRQVRVECQTDFTHFMNSCTWGDPRCIWQKNPMDRENLKVDPKAVESW